MKRTTFAVSILALLVLAGIAHAQFGRGAGPRFHSEFKPVVGGWSEYELKSKGERPSKMKIAIVGKEGDAYWYETVMDGGREGKIVSKMLVSGNPGDSNNVKRMIMKMGNEPAMEMPVQPMGRQTGKPEPARGKVVDKGKETIKVPAGTFTAQHMQFQDTDTIVDSWVHGEVAPYGLIKSQSKDFEMVLIGHGSGAKTLITEQPRKFEMPKMPMMKMPQKGMPPGKPQAGDDDDDDDEEEDDDE